jgi:hypothetical protein
MVNLYGSADGGLWVEMVEMSDPSEPHVILLGVETFYRFCQEKDALGVKAMEICLKFDAFRRGIAITTDNGFLMQKAEM